MDQDFWDCYGGRKTLFYNRRNTVLINCHIFQLYNFDTDDLDQTDDTEIIYYPPSEGDGSDTMARYLIETVVVNPIALRTVETLM